MKLSIPLLLSFPRDAALLQALSDELVECMPAYLALDNPPTHRQGAVRRFHELQASMAAHVASGDILAAQREADCKLRFAMPACGCAGYDALRLQLFIRRYAQHLNTIAPQQQQQQTAPPNAPHTEGPPPAGTPDSPAPAPSPLECGGELLHALQGAQESAHGIANAAFLALRCPTEPGVTAEGLQLFERIRQVARALLQVVRLERVLLLMQHAYTAAPLAPGGGGAGSGGVAGEFAVNVVGRRMWWGGGEYDIHAHSGEDDLADQGTRLRVLLREQALLLVPREGAEKKLRDNRNAFVSACVELPNMSGDAMQHHLVDMTCMLADMDELYEHTIPKRLLVCRWEEGSGDYTHALTHPDTHTPVGVRLEPVDTHTYLVQPNAPSHEYRLTRIM